MSSLGVSELRALERELRSAAEVGRTERLTALEGFRRQLVEGCGEEPTVLMGLKMLTPSFDDLFDVSLADFFIWFLRARSGAVYLAGPDADGLQRVAGFGQNPLRARSDGPVARWVLQHGMLVRSRITLAGLTAEEGEDLIAELDRMQANLVAPILVNESLRGLLVAGPRIGGDYQGGEGYYLSLFGMSVLACLERRRLNLPAKFEAEAARQAEALDQAQALWNALRPADERLKLLILDEEHDAAAGLNWFFRRCGFETLGTTGSHDLRLTVLPEAIRLEAPASGSGQTLPKPCRFARLARWVFEAASNLSLKRSEAPRA